MECFFNGFAETQLRTLLWNSLPQISVLKELSAQFEFNAISAVEATALFLKVDQRIAVIEAKHSGGNSNKSKHCHRVSEPFALPATQSANTHAREETWCLQPAT